MTVQIKDNPGLRRKFLDVCHRIYEKGFAAANDGNVSVRLENGRFLATPTGFCKGDLTNDDLIIIDEKGKQVEGKNKPSSEMPMHLAAYRMRPDIGAVVHAHPPYCTGFATAGIPLDRCVLPEIVTTIGSVPLTEYGTPSTEEVPDAIGKYIKQCDALLLANHGAVTVDADLMSAYYKMERIEHFAHILFIARQLGGEVPLSREQVEKLYQLGGTGVSGMNPGCRVNGLVSSETCETKPAPQPGASDQTNDFNRIIGNAKEYI